MSHSKEAVRDMHTAIQKKGGGPKGSQCAGCVVARPECGGGGTAVSVAVEGAKRLRRRPQRGEGDAAEVGQRARRSEKKDVKGKRFLPSSAPSNECCRRGEDGWVSVG